jgi:ABC-type multidrug transport system ATPase subunit
VLKVKGVKKAFGTKQVLNGVDILVERGDRLAIMGPNGIGKSTLLKIIMGELQADEGEVEWGYETHLGYFPQDNKDYFKSSKETAEGWIWGFCPEKDIGYVRSRMALMLFTGDESKKRLIALSGGESARLVFGRLTMLNPNVLVLDEPTNHLDLESIEALVKGLKDYEGTLVFVSHDRWFVGQLANRILEINPEGILDYKGTYEEYVHFCGDDHLDVDRVVLKAKKTKKLKKNITKTSSQKNVKEKDTDKKEKELWNQIDAIESRIREIDQIFAEPDYYERTDPQETTNLSKERTELDKKLEGLTFTWENMEKRKKIPG